MKAKKLVSALFILVVCFSSAALHSQAADDTSSDNSQASDTGATGWDYKSYITYGSIFTSFACTYAYGSEAWDWGENNFKWGSEGWFGADTPSGGIDKVGHFWTHYVLQRGFNNIFEWSLGSKSEALWMSAATAGGIGLLIEFGDGTSSKYGFAYEDLVADWLGVALGVLLEAYPEVDAFVGFTWEYWPTDQFLDESDGRKKLHVTSDYSGHRYMFNFKLAGFKAIGWDIPEFMRYVSLDFGYYTRGYTPYDETGTDKTRTLYAGVSLNMMEVVKDCFEPENREGRLCKGLQQPFKYIHLPIGYNVETTFYPH